MNLPTRAIVAISISAALAMALPTCATAQDDSAAQRDLLQRQINTENTRIEASRIRRGALLGALERSEKQAGVVNLRMRQIHEQLREKRAELATLNRRRDTDASALANLRVRLSAHLRTAYISGRRDYLKLLLNQEDPSTIARAMTYHGYVSRARATQILDTTERISELSVMENTITAEARSLALLLERANAAREELQAERARRQRLLEQLDAEIRSATERLSDLREHERSLGRVVASVERTKFELGAEATAELRRFGESEGQLLWPTHGRIPQPFSSHANVDNLHWQGLLISAPYGQAVHAIAAGRVAFADWIRGFGLVVIIEHGDGYMSLYGHAREVLHEPGAWVRKDELIAAVGDTGGQRASGLYFEIRKDGQPLNPNRWCAGSPSRRSVAKARQ